MFVEIPLRPGALLARTKWLLEGLISSDILENIHSLSFVTLVHTAKVCMNTQMEGQGARGWEWFVIQPYVFFLGTLVLGHS